MKQSTWCKQVRSKKRKRNAHSHGKEEIKEAYVIDDPKDVSKRARRHGKRGHQEVQGAKRGQTFIETSIKLILMPKI